MEGVLMSKHLYWLDEEAFAKIEPHLPRGRRGARRVDDRRVISGIIHMLRTGARWRDCPAAYGPYTTIYNRYHRWSRQGIWFAVFQALTGQSGVWGGAGAIDATHIKAHRSASGAKGGTSARRSAARAADAPPKSTP
jgi:transposase